MICGGHPLDEDPQLIPLYITNGSRAISGHRRHSSILIRHPAHQCFALAIMHIPPMCARITAWMLHQRFWQTVRISSAVSFLCSQFPSDTARAQLPDQIGSHDGSFRARTWQHTEIHHSCLLFLPDACMQHSLFKAGSWCQWTVSQRPRYGQFPNIYSTTCTVNLTASSMSDVGSFSGIASNTRSTTTKLYLAHRSGLHVDSKLKHRTGVLWKRGASHFW